MKAVFSIARPEPRQVMSRLLGIAKAEGISVDHVLLEKIAKAAQGDIRQMLNNLQMLKMRGNRANITERDVANR